jgi:arylsulfatase A-like enzyme
MKFFSVKNAIILAPCILNQCLDSNKQAISDKQPNILIAIGDDISFPHMGAYGCSWVKTPGFDRIAREGILFQNAYTPNAKSSPSRACLLTGRNSWQLEEAANHIPYFPPKFTTFMESLGSHGYDVGFTSKGWAPGVALDSSGNARELTGKAFNARKTTPPSTGISNSDYAANFKDFLNSREPGKPFCFWYGTTEPHRKYEYGSGVRKGAKKLTDIEKVFKFWPDNDIVRNDILDYAFEIEYFDSHLVKMLEILQKSGELSNTIVIVTSDNGMPFPRIKGQAYEYSNHMPLAIMWGKGIKNPGRTIYDHISFIDFAPTILEIAGIDQSECGMQYIEGKSFTNILFSRKNRLVDKSRDHVLIGKERHDVGRQDDAGYPIRGIVKNGFLYLINFKPQRWPAGDPITGYMNCDASPVKSLILNMRRSGISESFWNLSFGLRRDEELYYISADPECMNNLAGDPGYNNMKQKLREQLLNELREQDDPRILGNGDIFDKYTYASEASRDFYNRYIKGELSRKSAGWIDSTDFEER